MVFVFHSPAVVVANIVWAGRRGTNIQQTLLKHSIARNQWHPSGISSWRGAQLGPLLNSPRKVPFLNTPQRISPIPNGQARPWPSYCTMRMTLMTLMTIVLAKTPDPPTGWRSVSCFSFPQEKTTWNLRSLLEFHLNLWRWKGVTDFMEMCFVDC